MLVFAAEMIQKEALPDYPKAMKFALFSVACLLRRKPLGLVVLVCLTTPFLSATAAPPSVNIVTPASGTVVFAAETLNIAATSSDDGAVTNVAFLMNGVVATNSLNEPFLTLSNPV
ncbi:MAG TPA: Ig-like domain-containing protein, partial [Candidatus Binatia bacterium]|nr:Ig-like domain-containing protein [Candidatus Binatia bacterium]